MYNQIQQNQVLKYGPLQYRKWSIWGIALLHLVVLLSCLNSPALNSNGTSTLFFGLCISCFASCLAFWASPSRVLHLVVGWLAGTFTLKIPLCLYWPDETFLEILGLGGEVGSVITEKYASYSTGLLALVLVSLVLPVVFPRNRRPISDQMFPATNNVFFIAVFAGIAMLLLRFVVIFVLDIGRPGYVPRLLFIPGLTGVLRLLSSTGTVVVIFGALALALTRRNLISFLFASSLALAYLGMDMAIGFRRFFFLMFICFAWYYLFLNDKKIQARLKPLVLFSAIGACVLFAPLMSMRHSMIRGASFSDSLQQLTSAETYTSQDFAKAAIGLSKRLNGLDLYVVCAKSFEDAPLGKIYLINGQFGRKFAYEVMGVPEEVVMAMGSTIWGFWGSVLGERWIWSCGCMIAIIIFCGEWLCSLANRFPVAVVVCELSFSLWVLRLIMSSGTFLLSAKDLLIVFASLYVFYRFTWGNPTMQRQARRATQMQYHPQ